MKYNLLLFRFLVSNWLYKSAYLWGFLVKCNLNALDVTNERLNRIYFLAQVTALNESRVITMDFENYLKTLAKHDGSDLYLSTGAPPCAKFEGTLKPLSKEPMKPGQIEEIAYKVMDEEQQQEFEHELEMNLAYSIPSVARFRINIFKQRNEVSIVARNIKMDIPRFDDLKLPEVLKDVVMEKRGLILFVGGTGSGKSTSLAALIDHRNSNSGGHIITIEDPVEFVHRHKKSVINQREVGVDPRSFHNALKNTLRQAPDVILIGEIRDRETMEHALAVSPSPTDASISPVSGYSN